MAQALVVAINKMREVPEPMRESSNIQDMEILLEGLFPAFKSLFELNASIRIVGKVLGQDRRRGKP
jgi:hypothetical protein